jgi:hypothetical protein
MNYFIFRSHNWSNPAFAPEFIKEQSEGTYVTDIIIPSIRAALKGLPFKQSFICTYVLFKYYHLFIFYNIIFIIIIVQNSKVLLVLIEQVKKNRENGQILCI